MKTSRRVCQALVIAAMLAVASTSLACPVCFGESDSPIIKGAEFSILFLMGVTYALIGGGFATVIFLRRRQDDPAETAKEL